MNPQLRNTLLGAVALIAGMLLYEVLSKLF